MAGIANLVRQLGTMIGLGAGATYVIESSDGLRGVVLEAGKALARVGSGDVGGGGGGVAGARDDAMLNALTSQVALLSGQVSSLAGRPVTVVESRSHGAASSLTLLVPISVCGVVVYLKCKGYKFQDMFYVTQKGFTSAMENVKGTVSEVRKQLERRVDHLTGRVNQGLEQQQIMADTLSEARDKMHTLEGQMLDFEARLQEKLDSNGDKLDYAVNGIAMLCGVVNEVLEIRGVRSEHLSSFVDQLPPTDAAYSLPAACPGTNSAGGLKVLAGDNGAPRLLIRGRPADRKVDTVGLASLS
mmetsp:Transcript_44456/g.85034  ORF Transcript_44456/g.85034 Transcript_44456/m.85034 type:complete len:300 (+) Transcript_44456:87-986(+)